MNLLIEQRPRSITTKQTTSIVNHHEMNNSSSSLLLKLKRQENDLHSTTMNTEENSQSRSTTNTRLKRSMPNSATRRPSSPAFSAKQQVNKRSVTIDNNNNDLTSQNDEQSINKRFKSDEITQSTSNKVDASVETVSIGLATEPDQLGPCEPGTSVVLEGIVWNETDSGVLVVNVTWRGKTYVGTLLDSTKQDWACPRLISESPTSDYDPRHNNKTSRSKRGQNNRLSNSSVVSSMLNNLPVPAADDRKLRHNIKSRQSKRTNPVVNDDVSTNHSSSLPSPTQHNTTNLSTESKLISCPEAQCFKQFTSNIALNFHLNDAHRKTDQTPSTIPPLIPTPSSRDEEDVAHILVNVAEYVRRSSPDHQRPTTLSWPCPQISSKLVLSSPLNNNEQTSINSSKSTKTNVDENTNKKSLEQNDVKPTDHFLLNVQDKSHSTNSWTNSNNNNNKTNPAAPSSPAYSDISDEDSTIKTENEQKLLSLPPSTINLLSTKEEIFDRPETTFAPNTHWTTEMLLQQYGPYMQQQSPFNGSTSKEIATNRLNSKNPYSITSNGSSDSTVKNILDGRPLSLTNPSSLSTISNDSKSLYQFNNNSSSNELVINTLTSPNENLLKPSVTSPLDYSTTCSSTLHLSR